MYLVSLLNFKWVLRILSLENSKTFWSALAKNKRCYHNEFMAYCHLYPGKILKSSQNSLWYTAKLLLQSPCCDWTVTGWWLFFHLLVALVKGYKTMYLCYLDSYTVTVCTCTGYLVSSHVVTVQLPTRCLVERFVHRPHGSGYLITCVWCSHCSVVTVLGTREQ